MLLLGLARFAHTYIDADFRFFVFVSLCMHAAACAWVGTYIRCMFTVAVFAVGSAFNLAALRVFYRTVLNLDMFSWRFALLFALCNLAQILYIKFKH